MPSHDEQVDPARASNTIGFLREPQVAPRLRSREAVERMARRLLGIHWRLREYSLRPHAIHFSRFARESWFAGFDLEGVALAEGDLAIAGKSIARADASAVRQVQSIAMERHQAIKRGFRARILQAPGWLDAWVEERRLSLVRAAPE